MARRLRLTPFARFILVMIIVAPLAYIAASYYNGKDGIQEFKKLIGIEQPETPPAPVETAPAPPAPETGEATETADPATDNLQEQYSELKAENLELKKQLEIKEKELAEKDLEIKNLRQQLEASQNPDAQ